MKKIIYLSLPVILFTACSDEDNVAGIQPTPGEDVMFTTSVGATTGSRTIYADEATGDASWRINWLNGDMINVYSPQCATGFQKAPYKVINANADGSDNNTLNYALKLDLVNEAGVRWGTSNTANYYAVYPYVQGYDNFTMVGTHASIKAEVKANQVNNVPTYESADHNIFVKGDMPNNVMYANTLNVANGTSPVNLKFVPASAVLQFNLGCLSVGPINGGVDSPITIQEITVTSPTGIPIAGTMSMNFENVDNATDTPSILVENGTNSVTLDTQAGGMNITIPAGGSMTANVFVAVPSAGYDMGSGWKITVKAQQGIFSKELTGSNAILKAGQIHKINLPKFNRETEWTYEGGSWMSTIPSNVYVSELSLPGAWYAATKVSAGYQATNDISTLFDAGVRAFGVETRTFSDVQKVGGRTVRYVPENVCLSGDGSEATTPTRTQAGTDAIPQINGENVPGYGTTGYTNQTLQSITQISSIITEIANKVAATEKEYAVLVLSYADGGKGGHRVIDYTYWLQGLYDAFNSLDENVKANIYQSAITPNTTIDMVKRKLIIKVNVDNFIVANGNGAWATLTGSTVGAWKYSYNNNLPGLLSYTDLLWEEGNLNKSLISQMYWSTWDNSYKTDIPGNNIDNAVAGNLYWNYSVANRTATTGGTGVDIPTYDMRKASLTTMMQNSDAIYKKASHNVWFYFGAGGTQATNSSSETTNSTDFAATMNPWILEQINSKVTNNRPSPLGLVMCNQITNDTYKGPDIIKAVIEMNNKFYLQRDENAVNPTPAPSRYQSSMKVDTNGWNVF